MSIGAYLISYGLLVVILAVTLGVAYWIVSTSFVPVIYFHGGPYVPSTRSLVSQMVSLAQIRPGEQVTDLGSGDGRLVLAALKAGAAQATGYEINPWLVWRSRRAARRLGLGNRARFICRNMFKADLKDANVVFMYQFPSTMLLIEDKLQQELSRGARVVSNSFVFKKWAPAQEQGKVLVYLKQ